MVEEEPFSEISDEDEFVFEDFLRDWSLAQNIPHTALKSLLFGLNKAGHSLPQDPRTLLKTPKRTNVEIFEDGGKFVYIGLEVSSNAALSFHIDQQMVLFW